VTPSPGLKHGGTSRSRWTGSKSRFCTLTTAVRPRHTVGRTPTHNLVVLLVRYGEFEALLTGDAPVAVEEAILDDLPSDLEVLKVGHHGSNTSTSPLLLAQTSPEVAVISVGARNRCGHPHSDVLYRIIESGARILRTDLSGDIVIRARRSGFHDVRTEW
jgi:beta-lactamase superfamily II metal-dependent hydrolase